ncbi:MAG: glycosyltransferase family 39 protein, partial [Oscillospiraceae bacterium]
MSEYINKNYRFYLLWVGFSALACFIVFPRLSADYINYDSSYQYFLTQHTMQEIFQLLPEDYSPPVYAVLLKLFTMVFGNTLYVMRVFNLIILILLLYIAAFPVRRMFGTKSAVLCSVLMTISGINLTQMPEIRPT